VRARALRALVSVGSLTRRALDTKTEDPMPLYYILSLDLVFYMNLNKKIAPVQIQS
jgi:hypothetical protein